MKIKLNPQTHQPQTKNNNSRQMPNFLLSSHSRFFDYEQPRQSRDNKQINPTRNTSTIDFSGAPDRRHYPTSIKNISIIGGLMSDEIHQEGAKQKLIYLNKIFGQKKQFEVPSLYVESHRQKAPEAYATFVNDRNGFSKPFQFSKLVDELYSSKSIHRAASFGKSFNEVPAPSATNSRKISSRQVTRRSYATTHKSRKYQTLQDPQYSGENQIRRMSCQNTRDKHRKVYEHYVAKDMTQGETAFNNALSYLVDSDNIMQILEKNKNRKRLHQK